MDNHGRNIITCGIQICGHGDTNRCAIDANVSAHVGTNTEDGEEEGGTSVEDSRRQGPGKPTTSQADFQDRPSDQQFAKPDQEAYVPSVQLPRPKVNAYARTNVEANPRVPLH
ncbi:unnamed protein product [Prorocentrum cordatum]|uniref:DUF1540 domain-containing protein n=1 Tax=Prorocentrum cordatum TaxID=2364126 RepID=A0ABN9VF06_9DINO|nr:unnamed protein product [Polarella glacialis]